VTQTNALAYSSEASVT